MKGTAIVALVFCALCALGLWLWLRDEQDAPSTVRDTGEELRPSRETTRSHTRTVEPPKRSKREKSAPNARSRSAGLAALLDTSKGECLIGSIVRCEGLLEDFERCSEGDAEACVRAADEVGSTPPRDYAIETVLLDRACRLGSDEACAEWGRRKNLSISLEEDPSKEQGLWTSCDRGDAVACQILLASKGEEADSEERNTLLHRVCELGFDRGGCMALSLEGKPEQSEWALRLACDHQSPDGCHLYARHLLGVGPKSEGATDLEGANRAYATACELAPDHSACAEWAKVKEAGGWPDGLEL